MDSQEELQRSGKILCVSPPRKRRNTSCEGQERLGVSETQPSADVVVDMDGGEQLKVRALMVVLHLPAAEILKAAEQLIQYL